jgi:hypothetical protein
VGSDKDAAKTEFHRLILLDAAVSSATGLAVLLLDQRVPERGRLKWTAKRGVQVNSSWLTSSIVQSPSGMHGRSGHEKSPWGQNGDSIGHVAMRILNPLQNCDCLCIPRLPLRPTDS